MMTFQRDWRFFRLERNYISVFWDKLAQHLIMSKNVNFSKLLYINDFHRFFGALKRLIRFTKTTLTYYLFWCTFLLNHWLFECGENDILIKMKQINLAENFTPSSKTVCGWKQKFDSENVSNFNWDYRKFVTQIVLQWFRIRGITLLFEAKLYFNWKSIEDRRKSHSQPGNGLQSDYSNWMIFARQNHITHAFNWNAS